MDTNRTNVGESNIIYRDLSYRIIGLSMEVHNELGSGFLEKVYENALMVLFRENGIRAIQQCPVPVRFRGQVVGDYYVDILVEGRVILELKAQERIADIHKAQALNYLRATEQRLALIVNFGKERLESHRIVL